ILNKFDIKEYIESILQPEGNIVANFGQFETYNGIKLTRDIYLIIATAACHSSVRAGQKLSENEMLNILKDLNLLYNPYNCPHGRPVIWELSRYDLEKGFKRKI
ncbi:partial DNA mismatch repair protein MutL, partial [Patescibacteria group bacterium]